MIQTPLHSDLNQFQFFQRFRTGSSFDNGHNTYIHLLPDLPSRYRSITIAITSGSPPQPQIHLLADSVLRRDLTLTSRISTGAPPSPHCQLSSRYSLPRRRVDLSTTTLSHRNWLAATSSRHLLPATASCRSSLSTQPLVVSPSPTEPLLPRPLDPSRSSRQFSTYPADTRTWSPVLPSGTNPATPLNPRKT